MEIGNNFAFIKCKILGPQDKFHYLHILADTGNRARSVMDHEVFKKLCPGNQINTKNKSKVCGPGEGQQLDILGRCQTPIKLKFYNNNKDFITYAVRPLIVKNLRLPFILSLTDLIKLRAQISPHKKQITFDTRNGPVQVDLVPLPGKSYVITNKENLTIQPNQEITAKLSVSNFKTNDSQDLVFEPNEDLLVKTNILSSLSLSTVSEEGYLFGRFANYNAHPVTIPKNSEVGIARRHGETHLTDDGHNMIGHMTCDDESEKEIKLNRTELYKILWKELGFDENNSALNHEQKKEIVRLFASHRDALALNAEDVGCVPGVRIKIDTGDAKPIRCKARPLPPHLLEALRIQIRKWLAQGVICPGTGPWASPIVPVRKPNGTWRFAIDYRKLNQLTKYDARPVANMQTKLANLASPPENPYKLWATLDLSEAYHCVEIEESSQEKSAMITPDGLFNFKRMSFGLCGAPAAFHQVVQMIERGLLEKDPELSKSILLYFDDIIVGAHNFDDLFAKLNLLIEELRQLGLRIGPRKCKIGMRSLTWLGHNVNESGIQPSQDKVKALANYPPPKNVSEVKAIHGLASYFRRFIRNFASKTTNIRSLMKTKAEEKKNFDWNKKCQEEFIEIIKELMSPNILGHPNFKADANPFILSCDTSKNGIGAILSQVQSHKNPHGQLEEREMVIAYASRRLTEGERHYSSYKLELAGMVSSINHFRFYLIGKPFVIRTDNKGLSWLLKTTNTETPSQVYRWQQCLADYDFKIEFRPSAQMKGPDGLSRRGYYPDDHGNMEVPKYVQHVREPLWSKDFDDAKIRDDDDLWIKITKKKFSEEKEINCIAAMTTRRQKKLNMNQEIHENQGGNTVKLSKKNTKNTKENSNQDKNQDQNRLENQESQNEEQLEQSENFDEEPNEESNDEESHNELTTEEIPGVFKQGEEFLTKDQILDEIMKGFCQPEETKEKDDSIEENEFVRYLKKSQMSDVVCQHIHEILDGKDNFPKNFEEIRIRLLRIFKKIRIGKEVKRDEIASQQYFMVYLFRKHKKINRINGILMMNKSHGNTYIIPSNMRYQVLTIIHQSPGTYHLGQGKSLFYTSQLFNWDTLSEDVVKYIQTCNVCQSNKKIKSQLIPGLGQTSTLVGERLKRFAIDFVQMPPGINGKKYLFTMLDLSTSWVEAWAIKTPDSKTIIKILEEEVIPRYSENLVLICDGGSTFTSKLVKKCVEGNGCSIYISTNYWPNSLAVERCHRTLVSLIRCLLHQDKKNKKEWPLMLKEALKTMRWSGPEGNSPFHRVFGKPPSLRIDRTFKTKNLKVQAEQTVPFPIQEVENEDLNPRIVDEKEDEVIVETNGKSRTLTRHPRNRNLLIQEINCINEEIPKQEIFQYQKDLQVNINHERNKKIYEKGKKIFIPIDNELVDYFRPLDPESTSSRKLAKFWAGPYRVIKANKFSSEIQELEPINLTKKIEAREVAKVQNTMLRPSLFETFAKRTLAEIPWANEKNNESA